MQTVKLEDTFAACYLLSYNLRIINCCNITDLKGIFHCLKKICIIIQIIHAVMSCDLIYPIISAPYMKKNLMLFMNIYGFVRFPFNVFAWQGL